MVPVQCNHYLKSYIGTRKINVYTIFSITTRAHFTDDFLLAFPGNIKRKHYNINSPGLCTILNTEPGLNQQNIKHIFRIFLPPQPNDNKITIINVWHGMLVWGLCSTKTLYFNEEYLTQFYTPLLTLYDNGTAMEHDLCNMCDQPYMLVYYQWQCFAKVN